MTDHDCIAEREGFEPSIGVDPLCRFSKPVPSATRPPLQVRQRGRKLTRRLRLRTPARVRYHSAFAPSYLQKGNRMHLPVVTASAALLTLVGIVGVPSAVSPTYSSVEQLGWLTGCLEMRSGDRVVEEHRMGVRRNSILGMGRTTSAEGLSEYELTLIYEKEEKIVFEARPSGQPA